MTSSWSYVGALAALIALTLSSWGLAHVPLGAAELPVALLIAVAKASIVAIAFMELRDAGRVPRTIAAVTIGFIALICLGIAADVAMR